MAEWRCVVCRRPMMPNWSNHKCPPKTLKRLEREERKREAAVEDNPDPDIEPSPVEEFLSEGL